MTLPKTWDDVESVDDLVPEGEKEIIDCLEAQGGRPRCPHLAKLGDYFLYCKGGIPAGTEIEFQPHDPIYQARQGAMIVQMYCMGNFPNCAFYKGDMDFPGSRFLGRMDGD